MSVNLHMYMKSFEKLSTDKVTEILIFLMDNGFKLDKSNSYWEIKSGKWMPGTIDRIIEEYNLKNTDTIGLVLGQVELTLRFSNESNEILISIPHTSIGEEQEKFTKNRVIELIQKKIKSRLEREDLN